MSSDVKQAKKHRLILLVGEEEVLRRRALEELLSQAGFEKDDLDLQFYTADATPPSEWFASAGITPFLAERRGIVVRNVLRVDADDVRASDVASLPESALLVLVADDETGSDDKLTRMRTTVRKGWTKLVESNGGLVLTFEPDTKKAREAVLEECKDLGKTFTPAAIDALVEMTGGSLSRALDELAKIILFVGDAPQIRESDVREIVVPSREWNVFQLVEATLEGRVPEAFRQLKIIVSANSKAEEIAFRSILPVMSNQLRLVWQARMLIDAGKSPVNAPPEISEQFPAKPNLLKEREWRQRKAMTVARNVTLTRLASCFQILSDTDARLKGMLGGFNAMETLEMMVLSMSGTVAKR